MPVRYVGARRALNLLIDTRTSQALDEAAQAAGVDPEQAAAAILHQHLVAAPLRGTPGSGSGSGEPSATG